MGSQRSGYVSFTPLDVHFADVPRGHDLHITGVGIDQHAIRVEYRLTPALKQPGGRPAINWAWQDMTTWATSTTRRVVPTVFRRMGKRPTVCSRSPLSLHQAATRFTLSWSLWWHPRETDARAASRCS